MEHSLYRPVLTPRDPEGYFLWILQVNLRYMIHDIKSLNHLVLVIFRFL